MLFLVGSLGLRLEGIVWFDVCEIGIYLCIMDVVLILGSFYV